MESRIPLEEHPYAEQAIGVCLSRNVGTIGKRRGECHVLVFIFQMASEVAS